MKGLHHHHHHQRHHDSSPSPPSLSPSSSSSSSATLATATLPYQWNVLHERPSSKAIAIQRIPNQHDGRRGDVIKSEEYSSSTYETVKYDLATWRLYHRILEHRRQRFNPECLSKTQPKNNLMVHHNHQSPPPYFAPGAGNITISSVSFDLLQLSDKDDDIASEEGIFQMDL